MKKSSAVVTVSHVEDLGGRRWRIGLDADPVHLTSRPGQFFNIGFPDESPYLPRPFSVYEIHDSGRMDFLVAVVGTGTDKISRLRPGDRVRLIGPLGQGFPVDTGRPAHVFVAGSIGLAPFIEFHKTLRDAGCMAPHTLIYGARTADELVDVEFLEQFDWDLLTCTDDGSTGRRGFVTDVLGDLNLVEGTATYTCGPTPMMEAVSRTLGMDNLWVSMEEHMACGIGICKGCVLDHGNTPPPLKTVCKTGPVFEAVEVFAR